MAAPEIDSAEGINIGGVLIHNGELDGVDVTTLGTRTIIVKCVEDGVSLTTGDGKSHVAIPIEFDGMNLVSVGCHIYTLSTSGYSTFQIARNRGGSIYDMLSTPIRIDIGSYDSKDAGTPPVINTSYDDVSHGDSLSFDCDIAAASATGMEIRLGFRKP